MMLLLHQRHQRSLCHFRLRTSPLLRFLVVKMRAARLVVTRPPFRQSASHPVLVPWPFLEGWLPGSLTSGLLGICHGLHVRRVRDHIWHFQPMHN